LTDLSSNFSVQIFETRCSSFRNTRWFCFRY